MINKKPKILLVVVIVVVSSFSGSCNKIVLSITIILFWVEVDHVRMLCDGL